MIASTKSKCILNTLLFLCATVYTNAQNVSGFIYEDALTLHEELTSGAADHALVREILIHYSPDDVLLGNPFFVDSIANILSAKAVSNVGVPQGGLGAIYGTNVTKYADGLAKFLIERGKQELSMAFFDKMKKEFDKYPELRALFPKTTTITDNILNHNVTTLLQELRAAFEKDLVNAPGNILALRDLDASKCPKEEDDKKGDDKSKKKKTSCADRINAIKNALSGNEAVLSLIIAQGLLKGNNIIVMLDNAANDRNFCANNDPAVSYFKFSAIIMDALRTDKDTDGLFINEVKLRNLFFTPTLLEIFLGLTYEKYKENPCYKDLTIGGQKFGTILQSIRNESSKFLAIMASLDNVNASYKAIKQQALDGTSIDPSLFKALLSSSALSMENAVKAVNVVIDEKKIPDNMERIYSNINLASDLVIDIQQHYYAGIYSDIIQLIEVNNLINDPDLKLKITKYLSFAANMASATTSDEVKAAIDAVALPSGSFSVKQKSAYNIALNGYIGYAWDFTKSGLNARGLSAPVGFSFNKGLGKKNGGAVSIFVSLIDVGAIASYRLVNGTADTLKQEVRLESIVSPSAQAVIAVPKWPLSVCLGWRQTPKLFFQGQKEFLAVEPRNVFNISVLIDIPIFNIWTRPYE